MDIKLTDREFSGRLEADPFHEYYNLSEFDSFALTTDVDWAPDFAVQTVMEMVENSGFKLTCFATHDSPILKEKSKFVEVGLHPDNTRPTQEHGFARKIADLKELYPDAQGVRCHRNFFGQNIAEYAVAADLTYDASIFLWRAPFCSAFFDQFGMARLTYCWEDGVHADFGLPWDLEIVPTENIGMKIFNVHPILIYLNCPNDDYRREVTKNYSDLTRATLSELEPNIYEGYGVKNFYADLLDKLKLSQAKSYLLGDIVKDASRRR